MNEIKLGPDEIEVLDMDSDFTMTATNPGDFASAIEGLGSFVLNFDGTVNGPFGPLLLGAGPRAFTVRPGGRWGPEYGFDADVANYDASTGVATISGYNAVKRWPLRRRLVYALLWPMRILRRRH